MPNNISKLISFSHEVGDEFSFCNPEEGQFINSTFISDIQYIVKLKTGECLLGKYDFSLTEGGVVAASRVSGNISSAMDLVFRFTIKASDLEFIEYNNERFIHKNTNIYNYIYQENKNDTLCDLILQTKFGCRYSCSFFSNINFDDDNWRLNIYIRDEKGKWIVHYRYMPTQGKLITKNCTSWWRTRPIPSWMQSFFRINFIANHFLYRAELKPRGPIHRRIINLNTYIFGNLVFSGYFKIFIKKLNYE